MDQPTVDNPMRDREQNILYNVKAYRKLDRDEIVQAIAYFRSQQKVKPNKQYTIITTLGFND